MKRLAGKVVVVNGGTKGIGRAIAIGAASEGASVVVGGRSDAEGESAVEEIKGLSGDAIFVKGDVREVEACRSLIQKGVERFGRIDGLVNYTGILPVCPLIGTDEKLLDDIMDTNFKSAFYCTSFAVEQMLKNGGGGSIVNMGSLHAYGGEKDRAAYACSKAAMLTLSRHVANNYATDRIRSNWVTIGWVATPGELALRKAQGRGKEWLDETAGKVIPMGRMQTDEDNVHGVIYLLSDESSQVTGAELPITGGLRL